MRFYAYYVLGAYVIVATAVSAGGTASDTKTVIYNAPEVIPAPVITLRNPSRCPAVFQVGSVTITGTVENVSSASQVSILYNGENVEFTSSIASNTLTFSFVVNITLSTASVPLVITAVNASGRDSKSCKIEAARPSGTENGVGEGTNNPAGGNGNNGHGNNTDGNDESNPGNGSGGPNGEAGGSTDDENGKGNTNGTRPKPVIKPGSETVPMTRPTTRPASIKRP